MSKHKLLLADDSVTIQKVVNLTFADEGIEVISVGDGNSAMEKFVQNRPDLVMVDVNMPGVDGYRICEIIKQDQETKDIPVILLVGSFEPFDEEEARRVGANDYLTKPFQSIRQLVNKVTVLLNKTNGKESSAEDATQTAPAQPVDHKTVDDDSDVLLLGDTGMDDEMIQANQIGSLPVSDLQKFGSAEPDDSQDDSSLSARIGRPSEDLYQSPSDEEADSETGYGKTPHLTSEEYGTPGLEGIEEISSAEETGEISPPTRPVISEQPELSEERVAYLEEQMVSEFEAEKTQDFPEQTVSSGSEEPHFSSPEDYFAPREIVEEKPLEIEEIQPEKGFEIEEIPAGQDFSAEDTVSEYQSAPEPETSAPDYQTGPETFVEETAPEPEEESPAEPDYPESSPPAGLETENDVAATSEIISDQPAGVDFTAPAEAVRPVYQETRETAPPEYQPTDGRDEESAAGRENREVFSGLETEPPAPRSFEAEREVSDYAREPEQTAETAEVPDAGSGHSYQTAETGPLPDEITEPLPEDAAPETETEEKPGIAGGEERPADISPEDETTHSKVSALVSNKDRTDAVESVIVSEFARQSISLSAEAVETIAARIAERISEKIIQEMASEVVSDLADLIVEKMERKRKQE